MLYVLSLLISHHITLCIVVNIVLLSPTKLLESILSNSFKEQIKTKPFLVTFNSKLFMQYNKLSPNESNCPSLSAQASVLGSRIEHVRNNVISQLTLYGSLRCWLEKQKDSFG